MSIWDAAGEDYRKAFQLGLEASIRIIGECENIKEAEEELLKLLKHIIQVKRS